MAVSPSEAECPLHQAFQHVLPSFVAVRWSPSVTVPTLPFHPSAAAKSGFRTLALGVRRYEKSGASFPSFESLSSVFPSSAPLSA